jgi:hypothetical protein
MGYSLVLALRNRASELCQYDMDILGFLAISACDSMFQNSRAKIVFGDHCVRRLKGIPLPNTGTDM